MAPSGRAISKGLGNRCELIFIPKGMNSVADRIMPFIIFTTVFAKIYLHPGWVRLSPHHLNEVGNDKPLHSLFYNKVSSFQPYHRPSTQQRAASSSARFESPLGQPHPPMNQMYSPTLPGNRTSTYPCHLTLI